MYIFALHTAAAAAAEKLLFKIYFQEHSVLNYPQVNLHYTSHNPALTLSPPCPLWLRLTGSKLVREQGLSASVMYKLTQGRDQFKIQTFRLWV